MLFTNAFDEEDRIYHVRALTIAKDCQGNPKPSALRYSQCHKHFVGHFCQTGFAQGVSADRHGC